MLIVLDTTETFADLRMDGANYTFLRSFVARNPANLVVPQIVIEETVNHFRESLERYWDAAHTALRNMKKLAPDGELRMVGDFIVETECDKYREHLKKQLFLADRATYEEVDVSSLVQRALARKKPFDASGKVGFRDAVLWETILQLAKGRADKIVLVTRNIKDFGEHGQLHEHLCQDLTAKGLSHIPVIVCAGLSTFVDEYVKPNLEKLDDIQRQIDEDVFPGFDAAAFSDEWMRDIVDDLYGHVRKIDLDRMTYGSVYTFRNPMLGTTADTAKSFQAVDVWRINEHQLGIGVDYCLTGTIECIREDSHGDMYDEDYSDTVEFTLLMAVVIDETSAEIISWELTDIEVKATGEWGFPELDD